MKNQTNMKIPKKYQHMINEIYQDSDGYWCYTADGYYSPMMDCHTIHEDTQKQLMNVIRGIEPCDCDECMKALNVPKDPKYSEVPDTIHVITSDEFQKIMDSYNDQTHQYPYRKGDRMLIIEKDKSYSVCDNRTGDAWTEPFKSQDDAIDYLLDLLEVC